MTPGETLTALLKECTFSYNTEYDLQRGIAEVLATHMIPFVREQKLDASSRIDFMVDNGIGIEVKIGGTQPRVLQQLRRYLLLPEIEELILVTSRSKHAGVTAGGMKMEGKNLWVVWLSHQGL